MVVKTTPRAEDGRAPMTAPRGTQNNRLSCAPALGACSAANFGPWRVEWLNVDASWMQNKPAKTHGAACRHMMGLRATMQLAVQRGASGIPLAKTRATQRAMPRLLMAVGRPYPPAPQALPLRKNPFPSQVGHANPRH